MKLNYKIIDNKYYNIKEVLKNYFQISDRLLTKLKKNNKIFLNNTPVFISKELSIGDIISVDLDFEETSENIVPQKQFLDIVFEDEALLIINKPSNVTIHPSMSHFKDSISNGVKFYFNSIGLKRKIRPVNRLDKDTSGIVIFAKNEYIQECLIKQMKNNIFKKEYYAILEGFLTQADGTINAPISRKNNSIIEREINLNGDVSVTHFKLIKNFNSKLDNSKLSFVHFILETGRTHQIRVHSKYMNHPILGDSSHNLTYQIINFSFKDLCFFARTYNFNAVCRAFHCT